MARSKPPRFDIAAQVRRLGADSLLPGHFMGESEVFNGPVCKRQCKGCGSKNSVKPPKWEAYEIRTGNDGRVGIYTRGFNCRLATFNANTNYIQEALRRLFDHADIVAQRPKPKRKRRARSALINSDVGEQTGWK